MINLLTGLNGKDCDVTRVLFGTVVVDSGTVVDGTIDDSWGGGVGMDGGEGVTGTGVEVDM